eukprot:m.257655 g.257655  ORF g.257655 m.257655 type:complete len:608 (+) comp26599_c0_seq1:338-2161(+)
MRCHYAVLNVEFDATAAELKKSYRKAALKWHPDKNQNNLEEATMQFQLIQAAYAVLSDAHERQWYDDHRESILRGDEGDDGLVGDGMDLMCYFSPSCFRGYNDDETGFYTVYAKVFEEIWENELYVVDGEDPPPPFGASASDYVDVAKVFYRYWTGFTTSNTFAGKDKWDTREAPSRQVKRLMEKENKKLREGARKQYTLTVRQLATFVQGLDRKRKHRHQAAVALEREKARIDQQAFAEADRKKRLDNLDAMLAAEEAKQDWSELERDIGALEEQLDADFGAAADVESAADSKEWACVACSKRFKSEKQWANHQKSKKHLAAIAELREYMEEDDALFAASGESADAPIATEGVAIPLPDDFDFAAFEMARARAEGSVTQDPLGDDEEDEAERDGAPAPEQPPSSDISDRSEDESDGDDGDEDMLVRMMQGMSGGSVQKKSSTPDSPSGSAASASDESDGSGPADEAVTEDDLISADVGAPGDVDGGADDLTEGVPDDVPLREDDAHPKGAVQPEPTKGPRRKKKKKGGDRQAAREAGRLASAAAAGGPPVDGADAGGDGDLLCHVCGQLFDSRNKLFRHIETTGHALLRDGPPIGGKGKKGKKKKR